MAGGLSEAMSGAVDGLLRAWVFPFIKSSSSQLRTHSSLKWAHNEHPHSPKAYSYKCILDTHVKQRYLRARVLEWKHIAKSNHDGTVNASPPFRHHRSQWFRIPAGRKAQNRNSIGSAASDTASADTLTTLTEPLLQRS